MERSKKLRAEDGLHRVTPKDIQDAELARTAIGHPGWDLLLTQIQAWITEQERQYSNLQTRMISIHQQPHELMWLVADGREVHGAMMALAAVRDYLPALIKRTHPDATSQ